MTFSLVAAPAHAQENATTTVAEQPAAKSSGDSLKERFNRSRSSTSSHPVAAWPAVLLAGLMGGAFGSMLFGFDKEGSSSSVSSHKIAPSPDAPVGELRKVEQVSETMWKVTVYSPSMGKEIVNDVISPAGGPDNTTPRPAYYILGGAGGTPFTQYEGIPEFFEGKNVNVVSPYGMRGSMATDWREPHPEAGEFKWVTYLSRELPPVIDEVFHGTGRDAIAGSSAHGASALLIATLSDRFVATGTYSSCPSTSGLIGKSFAQLGVRFYKGDPAKMWGGTLDPAWDANSPVSNFEGLRGKRIFVTASRGIHSEFDKGMSDSPDFLLVPDEQLAYVCSHHFMARADKRGVDYDWYELYEGTHNLGTFQRELPLTWKTVGPALGVE